MLDDLKREALQRAMDEINDPSHAYRYDLFRDAPVRQPRPLVEGEKLGGWQAVDSAGTKARSFRAPIKYTLDEIEAARKAR